MIYRLVLLFLLGAIYQPAHAGWHSRKAEGWAWYDSEQKQAVDRQPPSPVEEISQVKKQLEFKLSQALLDPSDHNVREYMMAQKTWIDRSALFADAWSRMLLHHPDLDPTVVGMPVSQYGLELHKQVVLETQNSLIAELSKTHGLFFFYEGGHEASRLFARVVQGFIDKHHWSIFPISVDGNFLEEFPSTKPDNGITERLAISVFPSLVVVNPKLGDVRPIAFGLATLDQIEHNIMLQFSRGGEEGHD